MKHFYNFTRSLFLLIFVCFISNSFAGGTLSLPLVWGQCANTSSLPDWFGTDVTRGMAACNHKLYVVTRVTTSTPKTAEIRILDALTGTVSGTLSVNGLDGTGGHASFVANDIETSEDGQILTCNLALGTDVAAGMNKFKIFKWTDDKADPQLFIEYELPNDVRMGDHFTVQGSFADGKKAYIYAATAYHPGKNLQNDKVYIWTVTGGVLDSATPSIVKAQRLKVQFSTTDYRYIDGEFGSDPKVAPYGTSPDDGFIVNGNGMYPTRLKKDGAVADSLYYGNMNWGYPFNSSIIVFTEKGAKMMATVACDPNLAYDANIFAKDITNDMNNGEGCFSDSGIGSLTNGNRTSDIATDTINGNRYVFMLWTNNGITAHRLTGLTTGFETVRKANKFAVFPNPATNCIQVTNLENIESIQVFSMAGNMVLQTTAVSQLDISSLKSGIYLVNIQAKSGTNEVYKISKK